ncbi:MAG: hypothetical protein ACREQ8_04075 [Woeseiaceae bacterium]
MYDLFSGSLLTTGIVDRDFDDVGNVITESRSHVDAWTENLTETTGSFAAPDYANWWLDKLNSRVVKHHPVSQRHARSPAIVPGTESALPVSNCDRTGRRRRWRCKLQRSKRL